MHLHRRKFRGDEFDIAELINGNMPLAEGERHKVPRILLHQSFRGTVKCCHSLSFSKKSLSDEGLLHESGWDFMKIEYPIPRDLSRIFVFRAELFSFKAH